MAKKIKTKFSQSVLEMPIFTVLDIQLLLNEIRRLKIQLLGLQRGKKV